MENTELRLLRTVLIELRNRGHTIFVKENTSHLAGKAAPQSYFTDSNVIFHANFVLDRLEQFVLGFERGIRLTTINLGK